MNAAKDKYRALCMKDASIPLFSRDWWLDATAGPSAWDVAVVEKNGRVVAALPYSIKTRFGLTLLGQPPLTPALGPWFAPGLIQGRGVNKEAGRETGRGTGRETGRETGKGMGAGAGQEGGKLPDKIPGRNLSLVSGKAAAPGTGGNGNGGGGIGSDAALLSTQKECMESMIMQLPQYDHFAQSWHHRITNWLPFYWEGYTQTTRYTYTIPLLPGMDVLAGFTSNMRNKVRKAQRIVRIIDDCSLEKFFELNQKTFFRQRLDVPYDFSYVRRFDAELAARKRRKIFAAIDADGRYHSALYLCWDDEVGYVHMVGEDPELRQSGAGILLIHEAIQFCIRAGLVVFDFVGSMIKGVEIVRRSCGGMQTAYFHITKTPSRLLLARQGMLSLLRRK